MRDPHTPDPSAARADAAAADPVADPAADPVATGAAPARTVRAPDFPPGLDWVRAAGLPAPDPPPTLAALRGRVVLVDLWTYGCINCQHVAPELRTLERRFPDRLAVVGVHSGKFVAERASGRIAHAAARLGADHPVLNDRQFRAWRAWAARGWPTLALVDPRGYVTFQHAGERRAAELAPLVETLVARAAAAGELAEGPLPWAHAPAPTPPADARTLRYPSAVAVGAPDGQGARPFAVADAGHHRVLVGRLATGGRTFVVDHAVGGSARSRDIHPAHWSDSLAPLQRDGFAAVADGPAAAATFDRPQGVTFAGDGATLFVADTGNHAVRAVDVRTGSVRTVAGTGARLRTRGDRRAGAMASPWGVLWVADGAAGGTLLVAMAGTHELWRVDVDTGAAGPVAGGRGEGLVDGAPGDALLAQPAALAADGHRLWWTDAESSAVREVSLAGLGVRHAAGGGDAVVGTLVGTGLFDFGLADGVGEVVRLQHPQGLAWVAGEERWGAAGGGRLLVADSYNDVLRWLDPATRRVETWVGGFAEPGGVAVADGLAYVADTNAHRVAVVAPDGTVDALALTHARR
jgi:sugar lactone lactonase YvrE/thiol-disulfide isomerase/thioredoxin